MNCTYLLTLNNFKYTTDPWIPTEWHNLTPCATKSHLILTEGLKYLCLNKRWEDYLKSEVTLNPVKTVTCFEILSRLRNTFFLCSLLLSQNKWEKKNNYHSRAWFTALGMTLCCFYHGLYVMLYFGFQIRCQWDVCWMPLDDWLWMMPLEDGLSKLLGHLHFCISMV